MGGGEEREDFKSTPIKVQSTSKQSIMSPPPSNAFSNKTTSKRKREAFRAPKKNELPSNSTSRPLMFFARDWRSKAVKSKQQKPEPIKAVENVKRSSSRSKRSLSPLPLRAKSSRIVVPPNRTLKCVAKSESEEDSEESEDESDPRLAWLTKETKQSLYDQLTILHYQLEIELGNRPFKSLEELTSFLPRNGGSRIVEASEDGSGSSDSQESESSSSSEDEKRKFKQFGSQDMRRSTSSMSTRSASKGRLLRESSHPSDKLTNRESKEVGYSGYKQSETLSSFNVMDRFGPSAYSFGLKIKSENEEELLGSRASRSHLLNGSRPLTEQKPFSYDDRGLIPSSGYREAGKTSESPFLSGSGAVDQVQEEKASVANRSSTANHSFRINGIELLNPSSECPTQSTNVNKAPGYRPILRSPNLTAKALEEKASREKSEFSERVPSSSPFSSLTEAYLKQGTTRLSSSGMELDEQDWNHREHNFNTSIEDLTTSFKDTRTNTAVSSSLSSSPLTSFSSTSSLHLGKRKREDGDSDDGRSEDQSRSQAPLSDRVPALKTMDEVIDRWAKSEIELLDRKRRMEMELIEKEYQVETQIEKQTYDNQDISRYRDLLFVAQEQLFSKSSYGPKWTKDDLAREEIKLLKSITKSEKKTEPSSSNSEGGSTTKVKNHFSRIFDAARMELEDLVDEHSQEIEMGGKRFKPLRMDEKAGRGINWSEDEVKRDLKDIEMTVQSDRK